MRFIETWLPLIVLVREGSLDRLEMQQMSAGFERHFEHGAPFAVLSLADIQSPPMDALGRQRIAEWSNQPRVQRLSRELCAGSATVVAREGERRAMTALLWIWTPAAPHDAVHTVGRGIDFCLARLEERNVPLPKSSEAFSNDISRGLSGLNIAGMERRGDRASARPGKRSGTRRIGYLEKLSQGNGQIMIGWLERGVLWAAFEGHLSSELADLYAERIERLLHRENGTLYFVDSSGLTSFDLMGRTVAFRALIENRQRLASVRILNWSGGISSTGVQMLHSLGDLVQITEDREGFERMLSAVAPRAREAVAAAIIGSAARTRERNPRHRGRSE